MQPTVTELAPRGTQQDELVRRLRSGESSAFTTLMRDNNQRLYRVARGILKDDSEAEEALQESYVRAFTHIDRFKGDSTLATWLSRIVLNEALCRLRRRRPTVDIDELAETLIEVSNPAFMLHGQATPEQATARREIRRAIENAIDHLSPAFRTVFILRAIEQMSTEETSACLEIPVETVKTRFHRANKLLRQALATEFGAVLDGAFPFGGGRCDRLIDCVLRCLHLPGDCVSAEQQSDRPAAPRSPS